jgi:hypothetical protein
VRFGGFRTAPAAAILLLALVFIITSAVKEAGQGCQNCPKKGKVPSVMFQPGAEVTFNIYFVLPAGHHFGEDPAAAVVFVEEALKDLPVSIKPLTYTWPGEKLAPATAKNGMLQSTKAVEVKVKLADDCPLGELKIPAAVDVFFCNDEEGWCTSSHYDAVLTVVVSDGEECVSKGNLKVCVVANPPEM